jgi:hypothetical protein
MPNARPKMIEERIVSSSIGQHAPRDPQAQRCI